MSFTNFLFVTNCGFWDHACASDQLLRAALLSYMFINKHINSRAARDQRGERGPKNDNFTDNSTESWMAHDIMFRPIIVRGG